MRKINQRNKHDDRHRRRASGKRAQIQQRAEEDREKSGFEKLDLPAVSIPVLPDVDERHVKKPKHSEQQRIRIARDHDARKRESDPRRGQQSGVGMNEPKERRQPREAGAARSERFADALQKNSDGKKPVRADQRNDLIDRHEKRHGIDQSEQAENDKAGEPVGRSDTRRTGGLSGLIVHLVSHFGESLNERPVCLSLSLPGGVRTSVIKGRTTPPSYSRNTTSIRGSYLCLVRSHFELPHFQFLISGKSCPFLSMYSLCSINLSFSCCFR